MKPDRTQVRREVISRIKFKRIPGMKMKSEDDILGFRLLHSMEQKVVGSCVLERWLVESRGNVYNWWLNFGPVALTDMKGVEVMNFVEPETRDEITRAFLSHGEKI